MVDVTFSSARGVFELDHSRVLPTAHMHTNALQIVLTAWMDPREPGKTTEIFFFFFLGFGVFPEVTIATFRQTVLRGDFQRGTRFGGVTLTEASIQI